MSDNPLEQFINKNSNRAEEYRETIERMLSRWDAYGYAEQTLIAILEYIEKNDTITDGQIQAVENIKGKPSKNAW